MKPKLAENERICNVCTGGSVENEIHFLQDCVFYKLEREKLHLNISQVEPNLLLSKEQTAFKILSSKN